MQLCVRHRDRAAAAVHHRRLEEALWRELNPLQSKGELLTLRNG
jgi:hypothetical protein